MRFISSLSAAALLASSVYAAPTYSVTDADILQFALTVSWSRTLLIPSNYYADVETCSSNIWRTSSINKPSANSLSRISRPPDTARLTTTTSSTSCTMRKTMSSSWPPLWRLLAQSLWPPANTASLTPMSRASSLFPQLLKEWEPLHTSEAPDSSRARTTSTWQLPSWWPRHCIPVCSAMLLAKSQPRTLMVHPWAWTPCSHSLPHSSSPARRPTSLCRSRHSQACQSLRGYRPRLAFPSPSAPTGRSPRILTSFLSTV